MGVGVFQGEATPCIPHPAPSFTHEVVGLWGGKGDTLVWLWNLEVKV